MEKTVRGYRQELALEIAARIEKLNSQKVSTSPNKQLLDSILEESKPRNPVTEMLQEIKRG